MNINLSAIGYVENIVDKQCDENWGVLSPESD